MSMKYLHTITSILLMASTTISTTISTTASTSNKTDYYLNVTKYPNDLIVSSVEEFGCTLPGLSCSVDKTWQIIGYCSDLYMSVDIIETDYDKSNGDLEYPFFEINNNGISFSNLQSFCYDLNSSCTHQWKPCRQPVTTIIMI